MKPISEHNARVVTLNVLRVVTGFFSWQHYDSERDRTERVASRRDTRSRTA